MENKFTIKIDSREREPLTFEHEMVEGCIREKLDTGDYSIVGMEDILCIERKSSFIEFYGNITEKRFKNELDRMKQFKYKFLVLEFPLRDIFAFPYSLGVNKSVWSKLRLSVNYILRSISIIQVKYGIHVIFAENRDMATTVILNIMKEVYAAQS